ncbi:MAG: hydantoinase/oxoprolinase family protein [Acidobacteriota bacterium]|nr:hydantoinase/oxoprolinase family protein [Acidobacteriota bacterium]
MWRQPEAPSARLTRLGVDIGGTFTDVALEWPGGLTTAKCLTTPEAPEDGVIGGIATTLEDAGIDPGDVDLLIHGTTLATNTVIERKGAVSALITTAGFRDIIETGYESRYDQYDLYLDKRPPLIPRRRRFGVPERMSAAGKVLRVLDEDAVRALAPALERQRVRSVAVGFLHSYANPTHEQRVREILAERLPELHVSLSSEVCPEIREYDRLSTACANAYVQPLMTRYLRRLGTVLREQRIDCPIFLMSSGGGLMTLETGARFPIRLVESGPAGGAVLAGRIAAECALARVVAFDMGGTTAKLCLIDGFTPDTVRSCEVDRAARFLRGSGLPLRIPVIEMIEIGAGGGSVARVDELGRIAVGPRSAGADPGPACYGRGGEDATVTDADLVLGRIDAGRFAGGAMALEPEAANHALTRAVAGPLDLTARLAACGISEVVDERMANAARVHAIERGRSIGDRALIAFGGAAPLHAARLAEKLGIDRIVVPTHAGVGSAIGFLRAPVAYEVVRSHYMRLKRFDCTGANRVLVALGEDARGVVSAGAPGRTLRERRSAHMRYAGQGHEIVVPLPGRELTEDDADTLRSAFDAEYRRVFARIIPRADIEILSWLVTVSTEPEPPARAVPVAHRTVDGAAPTRVIHDPATGAACPVPVHRRESLAPGDSLPGPCLIVEDQTATCVSAKFDVHVDARGYLVLERSPAPRRTGGTP